MLTPPESFLQNIWPFSGKKKSAHCARHNDINKRPSRGNEEKQIRTTPLHYDIMIKIHYVFLFGHFYQAYGLSFLARAQCGGTEALCIPWARATRACSATWVPRMEPSGGGAVWRSAMGLRLSHRWLINWFRYV